MYNTGLDVSSGGVEQISQMNNLGAIPAYFELSTGFSGCTVLDADGNLIPGPRLDALNAILSNNNPNLRVGYYHFLYNQTYTHCPFNCYQQGQIFGRALVNNAIASTNYLFALDIENATYGLSPNTDSTIPLSTIEQDVTDFMNGLESVITGNFSVMIYSNLNFINNISSPAMYESSQLTAAKLWLASALPANEVYPGFQPNNSQIQAAQTLMNEIYWGGVQGWSGWQCAISGESGLTIDIDLFNMDAITLEGMYYNPIN